MILEKRLLREGYEAISLAEVYKGSINHIWNSVLKMDDTNVERFVLNCRDPEKEKVQTAQPADTFRELCLDPPFKSQ